MSADCEDPDQPPHYAVSDLGLHCLPMSQKGRNAYIGYVIQYEPLFAVP